MIVLGRPNRTRCDDPPADLSNEELAAALEIDFSDSLEVGVGDALEAGTDVSHGRLVEFSNSGAVVRAIATAGQYSTHLNQCNMSVKNGGGDSRHNTQLGP
ncbi:hypothetical protein [Natrinema versiforme]|uniref:hypothetical protein n=1 Tax=Natrinema versiforme TaxID=88724 RepID=UPI00268AB696|nr:hypothetical protein [Natrinema versiforme]